MNIYYDYPLPLCLSSGMVQQVIRDYAALAKLGHKVFLYGYVVDEPKAHDVQEYLRGSGIHLYASTSKYVARTRFLARMLTDFSRKVVVSRSPNKVAQLLLGRWLLPRTRILMEWHEDPFPHLSDKGKGSVEQRHKRFAALLRRLDGLVLTNASQEIILKREFADLPPYAILPNGVDKTQFSRAQRSDVDSEQFVLTYAGQFTGWKNIELLFAALAQLDDCYRLRIAGGKGDGPSRDMITAFAAKYEVISRVDYHGFVHPDVLVDQVINGSSALLLPLGDNLYSRFFTSPMKLFEYMATQIPVVAVDYPSVRSIAGADAIFLSENSPESFADAITQACVSDEALRKVAAMNQQVQQYTYDARAQRYNDFLGRI